MVTYIIEDVETGEWKIGETINTKRRLQELQTGNPHLLRIYAIFSGNQEKRFHNIWRLNRKRGEWFIPTQEMRNWFIKEKRQTKNSLSRYSDWVTRMFPDNNLFSPLRRQRAEHLLDRFRRRKIDAAEAEAAKRNTEWEQHFLQWIHNLPLWLKHAISGFVALHFAGQLFMVHRTPRWTLLSDWSPMLAPQIGRQGNGDPSAQESKSRSATSLVGPKDPKEEGTFYLIRTLSSHWTPALGNPMRIHRFPTRKWPGIEAIRVDRNDKTMLIKEIPYEYETDL